MRTLVYLAVIAILAACGAEETTTPNNPLTKSGAFDVVIDADFTNEIDDEFAFAYAALSPERLNIVAVHAAPYSLSPALAQNGALSALSLRHTIEELEAIGFTVDNIPVKEPGPSMEMAFARAEEMTDLLGLAPLAGVKRGSTQFLAERSPVASDAASNLVTLAKQSRDKPLVVIASGALTNVASALLLDPSIGENMVIVWTAAYPSFWPKANASFNLVQDMEAARVVFSSRAQVVYIPGYFVGEKLRVTRPEILDYVDEKGPIGDYLFTLYHQHPLFGDHYARSKVLWDMVSIGYVVNPGWFHEHSIGSLGIADDRTWQSGNGRPVIEVLDVARDKVFRDFYDKLEAQANK